MARLAQFKQDALTARIAGLSFVREGWIGRARSEALKRLTTMGLPHGRDEYWRYTRPDRLNEPEAPRATPFDASDEPAFFETVDRVKLVFTDGVFDAKASDNPSLAGIEIDRLQDAGHRDIHWAQGLYGVLESQGQSPVERPFAVLNTAFASDGILIRVTKDVKKPVAIIYNHESDSSDVILHHCIKLEEGADFTFLESGTAGARFNAVLEVDVADGAKFHHVRAQGRDHERHEITHIFARIGADALFKSFTLTANGRLTRNEAVIDLTGRDSIAHIAGAAMGDDDFAQDDTVFITHGAEHCESRQVYKKVLKGTAKGVFQGKILVRKGAQKTDGYQISQALLLDDRSQFLAKPELEIYADDVACSHGSTSGAIDETALFYLQSRGIPRRKAQSLLVQAFLSETIDEIDDPAIAQDILGRLESWVVRHDR